MFCKKAIRFILKLSFPLPLFQCFFRPLHLAVLTGYFLEKFILTEILDHLALGCKICFGSQCVRHFFDNFNAADYPTWRPQRVKQDECEKAAKTRDDNDQDYVHDTVEFLYCLR